MNTQFFTTWIEAIAAVVLAQRDHLTQLDAAIGDADHGTNMDRGFTAVGEALAGNAPESPGALLVLVGSTLIRKVGGASGPLYGTAFRQMGKSLGEAAVVSMTDLATAVQEALTGVQKLGGAVEGDKTMVDALAPAARALAGAARDGLTPVEAFDAAASAAVEGAKATIPLEARKGRASYLGPRSVGHEDPGAASTALLFGALSAVGSRSPSG